MPEVVLPPPIRYGLDGRILVSDELHKWVYEQGIDWDLMLTATSPFHCSFRTADRTFLEFGRYVSRCRYGSQGHQRFVPWLRALEQQKTGSWHIHAVLADCKPLDIEELRRRWQREFGGNLLLEPYDPSRGDGVGYLIKDVDFGADWNCSREVFNGRLIA